MNTATESARQDRAPEDYVLLADGSAAVVRRILPTDRRAVTELFDSCSETNLYTRFFTVGRGMVPRHVEYLCDKASDAVSYVAQQGGRIVGVADVEPCGNDTSEIAFLVADDMHGLGIATLILELAARDAWAAGTKWFVADVLAVNHPMLEVSWTPDSASNDVTLRARFPCV